MKAALHVDVQRWAGGSVGCASRDSSDVTS